tara:strand:- start:253 stop:549 length:297 start_codon:yes stop_codon:yes gene_type:complete
MKKLKIVFILLSFIFLNGCLQSTALLGPGMTMFTSGNILQAGLQYGASEVFKNEHGDYPLEYIKNTVEENEKQKNFHADFKNFLQNRIEITREKLFLN